MLKANKRRKRGKVQQAEEKQKPLLAQRRRERRHAQDLATTLQRERDMLEVIMETTSTQLAYLDSDFNFIKVNSAYARGSGHTAEELIGKNHFAFFPDPENQAIFEKVRDAGKPVQYTAKPFVYADQPERGVTYWDWALSPVKDASGCVQGLVLSLIDVTEKTRAEEALRASEAKDRALLMAIPDLMFRISRDGIFLEFQPAKDVELFVPPSEFLGKKVDDVLPGEVAQLAMRYLERALQTGDTQVFEYQLPIEGNMRDYEARIVVSGEDEVLVMARDITERKQMEEAIRESEEALRLLFENARDAIFHADPVTGLITGCNRAAETLLEKERGQIIGQPQTALHPPEKAEEYVEMFKSHIEQKGALEAEAEVVTKSGKTRPVLITASLASVRGKPIIQGVFRDITERKRAEEELERLRSEFLGMVTHELKTPLTAIKGSAATALGSQRALSAQENRELFQIVDEQADRLRELVDNLLDMTRIEAGSLSISPEPTDLRVVLEEARVTFVRSGGSHNVQLELADDLPAVAADRHRVAQVLTNLLNNAARFSPATAPITIAVEHDPLEVTVHVRDRGQGIPRKKLPLLFKKFSRVHEDAGQKLSGTGLGLAICKGIVEAHGGRIWADSMGEGQGSIFSFTLPVAAEPSIKALSDETRRAAHLGRVRRAGERTRVLAVDDEPQVLRYLQRSLDEAGYQPIVTSDPSQVAKLVELEEPDLVLLDLRLPGTSGFDLLRRIREFSGVPVIFLTASDRDEDTVRALEMGADDYITKPFSPSELLARIGAALRRRLLPDVTEVRPPFLLGDLAINFPERRVTVGGQEVSLSATEYKILYELATHAGRVLTHDQILQRVWGAEYSGETELVRSFIRNLRRKLGDDAQHPRFVLTERQVGYRMPKP